MKPILSHYQAEALWNAHQKGQDSLDVSLDLGKSLTPIILEWTGVQTPDEDHIPWEIISTIIADQNGCYECHAGEAQKIQGYSTQTGRAYSLYPTRQAPTMLISGLPMHRIKDTDPHQDTLEKIKAARPVGNVLDTCTGLGYTAIEASRLADHVTTIELDPAAIEICRANPWSAELFDNPKITQMIGDSFDEIENFPEGSFSRIIHDPPYLSLAGDLYSLEFYRELHRILSHRKGRLFHYIGDPESKSGKSTTAGVIRRLEQAGFQRIERAPRAFGVVAHKS